MAISEKLLKAINSAVAYLENAIRTFNEKDEKTLSENLWHVGAELEYAVFLFSLMFSDEESRLKRNPKFEKVGADFLIKIKDLLKESEKLVKNGKLAEAYENIFLARDCILKFGEESAKKKRGKPKTD